MTLSHLVVDGSNIATEGRTFPSLAQLESAIAELRHEHPEAEITVVVDATFAHRIDPAELARFEEALGRSEYITPPAGAIGRGDAFVLRIAEKVGATVVSNDSFQEFHGDHNWLFEPERLLGASPVPGVGWIFIPRTPVRGAKSRAATRGVRNLPPLPKPKVPPPGRAPRTTAPVVQEPGDEGEPAPPVHRRTRRVATSVAAVNDPATFISFIASHPLGEIIEAEVESFTSHGAVIRYDGVHCYAPLSGLGNPPPRSPREVLTRGQVRRFVIRGLDPERRGVELSIPEGEPVALEPGLVSAPGAPGEREPSSNHDGIGGARGARRRSKGRERERAEATVVPERASTGVVGVAARERAAATPFAPPDEGLALELGDEGRGAKQVPAKKALRNRRTTTPGAPVVGKRVTEEPSEVEGAVGAREALQPGSTVAAGKKAPVKKAAPKKAAPKKAAPKKAAAKKAPVDRAIAKKALVAKAPAKKATATKAPQKKAPAKESLETRAVETAASNQPLKTARKKGATRVDGEPATTTASRKRAARVRAVGAIEVGEVPGGASTKGRTASRPSRATTGRGLAPAAGGTSASGRGPRRSGDARGGAKS